MHGARNRGDEINVLREPSFGGGATTDFGDIRRHASVPDELRLCLESTRVRSLFAANRQWLAAFWEVGAEIALRQDVETWGGGLVRRLALDLKEELPNHKQLTELNLNRMVQFYRAYPDLGSARLRPVVESDDAYCGLDETCAWVRRLPRSHNVLLMQAVPDLPTRRWYMQQAVWDRRSLNSPRGAIQGKLHERRSRGFRGYFSSDRCKVDHICPPVGT